MALELTKKYGIVQYRGTMLHNSDHRLVFETDEALEVMDHLEKLRGAAPEGQGYILAIRGVGGIGDATLRQG